MDTCIICGEYVPEGTWVCINCVNKWQDKQVKGRVYERF